MTAAMTAKQLKEPIYPQHWSQDFTHEVRSLVERMQRGGDLDADFRALEWDEDKLMPVETFYRKEELRNREGCSFKAFSAALTIRWEQDQ